MVAKGGRHPWIKARDGYRMATYRLRQDATDKANLL
jgi:hypothetical protein